MENPNRYPVSLSIDYPDRNLNRLTTFFRIFTAIPIVIIIGLLLSAEFGGDGPGEWTYQYAAAGLVFLPIVLMLLFRQKYPKWWFDWNVALIKFSTRVEAYLALLRDEYPSTDEFLPRYCGYSIGGNCLVCHLVYRPLPAGPV